MVLVANTVVGLFDGVDREFAIAGRKGNQLAAGEFFGPRIRRCKCERLQRRLPHGKYWSEPSG